MINTIKKFLEIYPEAILTGNFTFNILGIENKITKKLEFVIPYNKFKISYDKFFNQSKNYNFEEETDFEIINSQYIKMVDKIYDCNNKIFYQYFNNNNLNYESYSSYSESYNKKVKFYSKLDCKFNGTDICIFFEDFQDFEIINYKKINLKILNPKIYFEKKNKNLKFLQTKNNLTEQELLVIENDKKQLENFYHWNFYKQLNFKKLLL